jgi:glycosyltransferase involved in cell wall biosynthesis
MSRIAMISEHASPVATLGSTDCGGQNVYVDQVSRGVAKLGNRVDIYTRVDNPNQSRPFEWSDGVRVVPVRAGPARPIAKDVIWSHLDEFLANTRELMAALGPYDVIHGNFWMSGWVGAQLRRELDARFIQIFHALGAIKRLHQGEADTSPADRCEVERAVLDVADRVIAQCPAEVDDLVSLYGADTAKLRVVPSGVDLARFFPLDRNEARHELRLSPDERIVVYVGRLLPRKDVANLIEALAILRDHSVGLRRHVRLIVVGGETVGPILDQEPEMCRLIQLALARDVAPQVTFVGRKPSDYLRWYYSAADVFVTTPWYEPYGLTPLEAMACGIPVVCSGVGGITYTVADGVTGFLVPPRQPKPLADRLANVLADDKLRLALGRSARRRVVEDFSWSTVALRTAEVYRELARAATALSLA